MPEVTTEEAEQIAVDQIDDTTEEVEQVEDIDLEERARIEEQERLEREQAMLEAQRAADAAAREERAQRAVETLSQGAGFNASYGTYYDASHGIVTAGGVAQRKAAVSAEGEELSEEDIAEREAEAGYVDPVLFGRQVAKLTEAVTRNPLQREIFYQVLSYCQESKGLQDIEAFVQNQTGFAGTASNPYHFIKVMEHAGGLERFELDADGEVVTDDRKLGLTENEIDDLVESYAFMTTPAGQAVVDQHTPRARMVELLDKVPERRDTYVELMDFLSEEPRTYNEIVQLLQGRDVLWHLDTQGNPEKIQPSVFVDKLEAAAGIEWRGNGWLLTKEGASLLRELNNKQQ